MPVQTISRQNHAQLCIHLFQVGILDAIGASIKPTLYYTTIMYYTEPTY